MFINTRRSNQYLCSHEGSKIVRVRRNFSSQKLQERRPTPMMTVLNRHFRNTLWLAAPGPRPLRVRSAQERQHGHLGFSVYRQIEASQNLQFSKSNIFSFVVDKMFRIIVTTTYNNLGFEKWCISVLLFIFFVISFVFWWLLIYYNPALNACFGCFFSCLVLTFHEFTTSAVSLQTVYVDAICTKCKIIYGDLLKMLLDQCVPCWEAV